ncbi:MAG TPA: hypothetical protein VK186_06725 [Candidatus Deferrimicrobium sp.]|nr:hypothetical protein [Candidatus Deferrimicrobium sp.]
MKSEEKKEKKGVRPENPNYKPPLNQETFVDYQETSLDFQETFVDYQEGKKGVRPECH